MKAAARTWRGSDGELNTHIDLSAESSAATPARPVCLCVYCGRDALGRNDGGSWACGVHMEIPCTCTIACVPEGITDEQTCRLWLENGRSWDGCCCPSVSCLIHHEHLEDE